MLLRRSEEHTSELQSRLHLVCRLLLEMIRLPPRPTPFPSTTLFRSTLMTGLAKERKSIGGSIDGVSKLSEATASLVAEARPPLKHDVRTAREFGRISVD